MADITYIPKGHSGYVCEVKSAQGKSLRITRVELNHDPVTDGDAAMTENTSLVRRLGAYADSEMACRRTRNESREAAFRKSADLYSKMVLDLADLIDDVGEKTVITEWCSGCLQKCGHRWVQRRSLTPDAYLCGGCGAATTPCPWPGCDHFALRKPSAFQLGKYCAEHRHDIPGFEKLDTQLDALDDYESWMDFDSKHAKRITAVTGGILGGALIVAPLFFAAAPALGGAIGMWSGLSGAAASSHGLAVLGGGAVATGGFGMAGGTAVVTAAGAGLGGKLGASVTAAYAGDDPSFAVELIERGVGPSVVFSNGFLSEDQSGWGEWEPIIRKRYPDATVYRLHWGAKEIRDLRAMLLQDVSTNVVFSGVIKAALRSTRLAVKKVGLIGGAFTVSELAKNPWWVARTRANMTGAVLADLISRTNSTDYVLVGHSLGARVMLSAAQALGSRDSAPKLESVHLIGAAVSAGHDLTKVGAATSGTLWNYWSSNDQILRKLYRGAERGERAAGAVGFAHSHPNVRNRNVSRQVDGHSKAVASVTLG